VFGRWRTGRVIVRCGGEGRRWGAGGRRVFIVSRVARAFFTVSRGRVRLLFATAA